MDLVRDVLDKQVVDRNGREMGRVDTIVLERRDDAPPRVVALELGPEVLAARVRPIFGRWVAGLEHAFGVADGRPFRIPFSSVLDTRDHVKVDLAVGATVVAVIEQRLRRWVSSIPGSS
jgi:sporulation protein YlmC with PRC-barrel domain